MRWKSRPLPDLPKDGDRKVSAVFALWPTRLEDGTTVWLTAYFLEEQYGPFDKYNDSLTKRGWWVVRRFKPRVPPQARLLKA